MDRYLWPDARAAAGSAVGRLKAQRPERDIGAVNAAFHFVARELLGAASGAAVQRAGAVFSGPAASRPRRDAGRSVQLSERAVFSGEADVCAGLCGADGKARNATEGIPYRHLRDHGG